MAQHTLYKYTLNDTHSLSMKTLLKISKCSKEIELGWMKGKFVFSVERHDGEFMYSPERGDDSIFGKYLEFRGYALPEFLELCWGCEYLRIFTDSLIFDLAKIAETKIIQYVSYPQTITDLEKLKFVSVEPSTNFLRVDERKFRFEEKSFEIVPSLREYQDFYEVDSLGTYFFEDLSKNVVELWICVHKNN